MDIGSKRWFVAHVNLFMRKFLSLLRMPTLTRAQVVWWTWALVPHATSAPSWLFIAEPNSLRSFSVLLHRPFASIGQLCAPCFAQNPPHCPVSNPFALRLVAVVCGSK